MKNLLKDYCKVMFAPSLVFMFLCLTDWVSFIGVFLALAALVGFCYSSWQLRDYYDFYFLAAEDNS